MIETFLHLYLTALGLYVSFIVTMPLAMALVAVVQRIYPPRGADDGE